MAIVYGSTRLNGTYTKIVRFNMLDNDIAQTNVFDYTDNGLTDFAVAPIDYHVVTVSSAADAYVICGITANATTGFTVRCFTGTGAGGVVVIDVIMRNIHSIDQ